jgi:cytoskeletal protein CcmA (bactofilin family)
MRRLYKLLLLSVLLCTFLGIGATQVHAQSFQKGSNVTVDANRTLDSTLFATGKTIDIAGTVNGDVFCAGQNITISGTVNGDVLCAGESIHISGNVKGDVRVAGQNITLDGTVGSNMTVLAQTLSSAQKSTIAGDLTAAGQDATLNGAVQRDVALSTGSATVNSAVGRNLTATVENLTLDEGAKISGNVAYTSEHKLARDTSAVVLGHVTQHTPEKQHKPSHRGWFTLFALFMFLSMLLLSLLLVLAFPRVFQGASNLALERWGKTLAIGFIACVLMPVVIITLVFTFFGIPLAILLTLIWLVILFLSGPFSAYLTGRLVLRNNATNALVIMLVGSAILLVLYFVPFIGMLALLLAIWFGVGMILQSIPFTRPKYAVTTSASSTEKTPTNKRERR